MTGKDRTMESTENTVLCGANSYEQKYYFNPRFGNLPEAVQRELQIACVVFTEEVGGILTLEYRPDGSLTLNTQKDEADYLYDEIEAELQIRRLTAEKEELLESLENYYRVFVLGGGR